MPVIIACLELPAKEKVCAATYRQATAHTKRKAVECLLYKCSLGVSEVQDTQMQNGDSYRLLGSADRSIKYGSRKVALWPEPKILQQP